MTNKKSQIGECPTCFGVNTEVTSERNLVEGWTETKIAKMFVCYNCGTQWIEKYRMFYEGYGIDGENFDEYGERLRKT